MSETRKPLRLQAIDALRGLLMVLMALDHANYFIAQQHSSGEYWGGAFPKYPDAWHFITRAVTHLSAPGFFLLMGVGMALFAHHHLKSGDSRASITRSFIMRGFVLIAMQMLVVIQLWKFSPGGWGIQWYFGVLWALGGSMVLCSFLVWFDERLLLGLSAVVLILAEFASPPSGLWGKVYRFPVSILFIPGGVSPYWVNYPVLQWVELAVFGLAVGKWVAREGLSAPVRKRLWMTGAGMLGAFVVLRVGNGFGNIRPRAGNTCIDFFNLVKYPPSMTYTLLTTGVNLVLLAWFAGMRRAGRRRLKPLVIFGRVPLFFYLAHLAFYAGLGSIYARGGTTLRGMAFFWLYGLLVLLPVSALYGKLKRRAKGWLGKGLFYL